MVGEKLQLVGGLDLSGHVVLNSYEVGDATFVIADRGEIELIPEGGPILAVVAKGNADVFACVERVTNLSNSGLIPVGALKESATAATDFAGGIAGHALEGGVDVGKRKFGIICVSDGDAVADGIEDAAAVIEIVDHGAMPIGEGLHEGGGLLERGRG